VCRLPPTQYAQFTYYFYYQSQSAAYEINLQTALEAQIQQHLEAVVSPPSAISPPDPADSLQRFNSDSAVSDMSTPGLSHQEYFDPVSVQHSQVITQKRLSKDLSTPASIAEVVEPVQGHAKQPSVHKVAPAEAPQYYEEKQAFFPDHAPLKINPNRRSAEIQSGVFNEQQSTSPPRTTEVFTRTSPPRAPVVNDGPKPFNTSPSNQPGQFVAFSHLKDTGAVPNLNAIPETKLDTMKPPTDININQTATHPPATKAPTSWPSNPRDSIISNQSYNSYSQPPTLSYNKSEKPAYSNAEAESLYDGDGYGDYDDYSDDELARVVPPRLLQVRRT
jgi:hypothetical protein